MTEETKRAQPYSYVTIGLISCAMLMYEVLLTRVCALRLFFHFGFLVVSNCLLGIGASGSLIAVFQDRIEPRARTGLLIPWVGCRACSGVKHARLGTQMQ